MKNEKRADLSSYIKSVSDQEAKVLLLKLKNEIRKEDASWEQIREVLSAVGKKNIRMLKDIVPLIVD